MMVIYGYNNGVGRTTLVYNVFSMATRKTIFIDGDVRDCGLTKLMKVPEQYGSWAHYYLSATGRLQNGRPGAVKLAQHVFMPCWVKDLGLDVADALNLLREAVEYITKNWAQLGTYVFVADLGHVPLSWISYIRQNMHWIKLVYVDDWRGFEPNALQLQYMRLADVKIFLVRNEKEAQRAAAVGGYYVMYEKPPFSGLYRHPSNMRLVQSVVSMLGV